MDMWAKIKLACGTQAELARRVGVVPMAVTQWKRHRRIPADKVLLVEKATGGQVTRHEMRPDLYPVERVPVDAA
jgi:DNA-binding transcriptional regulator YdaS (Cro superfamily)